jgi:hypothetical protein
MFTAEGIDLNDIQEIDKYLDNAVKMIHPLRKTYEE